MEFLNLSLLQFGVALGAIAAFSVALYLLDRNRRRQVVATLRFWVMPGQPAPVTRRRRIQQPLSLLLQLLGMLLLLLAIAELQFGNPLARRRDHVLVLDNSAWMGAALPGRQGNTLMDMGRANAIAWLRAVPSSDRVLLVRANGLATPATAWELDHRKIVKAILETEPGVTVLSLSQSLQFARNLQRQSGSTSGEVVYVGPGRITKQEAASMAVPQANNLRILPVDDPVENVGLRSVGARRADDDPGAWKVLVRVRNYGRSVRTANLTLNFGHAPVGAQAVQLPGDSEKEVNFTVHTNAAGVLETRLYPRDAFGADNFAALELPQHRSVHVVVYSAQPELLRPAFAADPRINAEFRGIPQYSPENDGLIVIDRLSPPSPPKGNVLWIDPPADKSPVPIRQHSTQGGNLQWVPGIPVTESLRAHSARVESASIFEKGPNDVVAATIDEGPVIVARTVDKVRTVVVGFEPFTGALRFELSTPLLVANALRWLAPDAFREVDVGTQSAGAVAAPFTDSGKAPVEVLTDNGNILPFNVRDKSIMFFAGDPSRVRVISGNTERVYSLTLPEMWDVKWTPPAGVKRGIPPFSDPVRRSTVLWPWLALGGATLLIAEWLIFGRQTTSRLHIIPGGMRRVT
jgi:hypothetical protein